MPEHGPFSWPKRRVVALDGRFKGRIDSDGSGNLFWNVTRTETLSEANLIQEACQVTFKGGFGAPEWEATAP